MDGAGRKKALDAIAQLNVGGTTNLSGGLLQGCDLLLNKPETGATATRAVLLFTDGMANAGIQDTPGILAASAGVISACCGCPSALALVFALGDFLGV